MPIASAASVSSAFTPAVLAAIGRLRLIGRTLANSRYQGGQRSRLRGRSLDLSDYREYVSGDDLRDIDWSAYARTETLFVRVFSMEAALPLRIIVDPSASMRWGEGTTKYVAALQAAVALALIAARSQGRVHLIAGRGYEADISSIREEMEFLKRVDRFEASGELAELIEQELVHGGGRQFSDGYDLEALLPLLRRVAGAKSLPFLLQTFHQDELDPPVRGELTLVDSESLREMHTSLDQEQLAEYKARLSRFMDATRSECRRAGIGYGFIAPGLSLEQVAARTFVEAGLVELVA
ncbi:MAG: DUF58 domain-containing protein [Planctomycetes bacterium]|nr:DUF58 domain-containing protein [Planctomycetota bacterium]